ncbi:Puromycin resistance protein pur8 [Rhodococcus sp. Leaf7]|uniref:MFS transporter n=1 Tax=unclassified Rhodococcus (in: high G+C Gram-positive bacteria) TaxID=192944 RepID=UPI0006FF8D95|nr:MULTISPECIES: MFS transporter [unclassified Rhodococcus (in: high G+C Gram-positive bacteria)]KQU07086.1 Puromycin resistance protein pur8 [Rhodococcus sp. Leaf7]KQU42604.1 Puromycin resistance protein pur8 [Rhodococcus sp. Leaf247]
MTNASAQTSAGSTSASDPNYERRWLVLVIVAVTQLMIVLDATIVNIALPQAQADLAITDGNRTWVVTAYALAFGALLLLGGRISDYWGRRRSFVVGMSGFAVASAVGGLAQESWQLFVARAGQGIFAALLAPAALAILTVTFTDPKERAKAFGVFGAIAGGGAAVGLLLGGVLTEYLSWRWCLLVNVPVAVIAVVAAIVVVKESKADGDTRYDLPGAVLVALGLGSLVYGFTRAEHGWGSVSAVSFIAIGLALVVAFGYVEARSDNPLLPLSVLFHRDRGPAFFASMMVGAILVGATLFLTFYFQIVLQYSPIMAGLASMPITAGIFVTAGIASALLPRFGPKPLMSVGPVIAAVGLLLLTRIGVDSSYWASVFPALILVGLGLGLLIIPQQNVALIGVADHDAGAASALVNATMQVGGALGAAIFTSVYTSGKQTFLTDNPAPTPPATMPSPAASMKQVPSDQELAAMPESMRDFVLASVDRIFQAEVNAYHTVFAIAAVFIALISPVVVLVVRAKKDDLPAGDVVVHAG